MLPTAEQLRSADDAELLGLTSRPGACEPVFRELYRRYHRPLYAFALRRLDDRSAAEEVVQESFVRLWRAAGDYDSQRGTVPALLFTIARNVSTDLQRRKARSPITRELIDEGGRLTVQPAEESSVTGTVVAAAMGRLPVPHREVLDLAYWGDLTQSQIADALSIPLGTVKSRVFLALKGLRTELASLGVVA